MGARCGCGIDPKAQTAGNDIDCENYYTERNLQQVREWLNDLDLSEYYDNFIDNGFDKLDIITNNINNKDILKRIGIDKIGHQIVIIKSIQKLNEENDEQTMSNISSSAAVDHIICDNEPLIPNMDKKILKDLNHSKLELQFPVIQTNISLDQNWKCYNCDNVNSEQTILCLKCGVDKNENKNNKKQNERRRTWIKEGVDV